MDRFLPESHPENVELQCSAEGNLTTEMGVSTGSWAFQLSFFRSGIMGMDANRWMKNRDARR
jgi:hypothetical protein